MPKYVIEREIPGAGNFTDEDLKGISQKSCGVLDTLGTSIQWIQSYVTDDKIYCVYRAASEDLIREHAEKVDSRPTRSPKFMRRSSRRLLSKLWRNPDYA